MEFFIFSCGRCVCDCYRVFSRMLRRRVPVLKLVGRLPNVVALCPQSVRKRPQSVRKAFASVRKAFASVRKASASGVMRAAIRRNCTGRVCPRRSESVKLRGNCTGRVPPWPLRWSTGRSRGGGPWRWSRDGGPMVVVPWCGPVVVVPWRWSRDGGPWRRSP